MNKIELYKYVSKIELLNHLLKITAISCFKQNSCDQILFITYWFIKNKGFIELLKF